VPRGLASLIVLLLFLLALVLIFLLLVPILQAPGAGARDQICRSSSPQRAARPRRLMQMVQERLPPEDLVKLRDAVGGKVADVFACSAACSATSSPAAWRSPICSPWCS